MQLLDLDDDLLHKILSHVLFPNVYAAQACTRLQRLIRPRVDKCLGLVHGSKWARLKRLNRRFVSKMSP
jgi:hypothetical protein